MLLKKNYYFQIKNILLVILGTLILSFGTAIFILPFKLLIGGISSYAIIAVKLFSLSAKYNDLIITVITWALFLLGAVFLGKSFALKTLVSAVVYPLGITLFSRLLSPDALGGLFLIKESEYSEISVLLAAVFGGILTGTGCAVTFLGDGSTGGVDILAFIICKFFPKLKSSKVIFFIDASTVILGIFIIKDLVLSLLGLTAAFVGAIAIDKIFIGESTAFIAQIVSDKYKEINSDICSQLERTTSIVKITGGYSGKEKNLLIVTFSKNQYADLIRIINLNDRKAFVTVQRAHQANGQGWSEDY